MSRRVHFPPVHVALLAILLPLAAAPARAAVTVYTSLAAFQADAPTATLQATFESKSTGSTVNFSEGGLAFSHPINGRLYIVGPSLYGATNPVPASKMLTGNGTDDLSATVSTGTAYAIGFTLLTNGYAAGTATLYDQTDTAIFTHLPAQLPNTVGFLGFISTTPIKKARWVSVSGGTQNSCTDNYYVAPLDATPTANSTWGRLKRLYR